MRRFEDTYTVPKGIFPRSYYILQDAKDVPTCHEAEGLRHPFSIYSFSLSTIRVKIDRLLDRLALLYTDPKSIEQRRGEWDVETREATDSLLDALMEHFDDCHNVLNCYMDSWPDKKKKKYYSIVSGTSYRTHLGKIVNSIKHRQRCIRIIIFHGSYWAVPGYFIEGPAGKGIVGPDPDIHKGGGTAFSFRRDLFMHLVGIYYTSQLLASALAKIDDRFAVKQCELVETESSEEAWCQMILRIEPLSSYVFPDEANRGYPSLKIDDGRLRIEYPARYRPSVVPNSKITVSSVIDGMSPSIRVPYFLSKDRS